MSEPASWVIVDRKTGRAVFETFDRRVAKAIRPERYEVVTILQWLYRVNAEAIKTLSPRSAS